MASLDTVLLLTFVLEALIVVGLGYVLITIYRRRTQKVRKLRKHSFEPYVGLRRTTSTQKSFIPNL